MAADSNIFAQYLRPVRSVQDYSNDMDAAEQNKLTLAASRMKAQQDQQGMADDNALRSAYQQSGGDNNALLKILQGGGRYKAAQAVQKSMSEQAKAAADLAASGATTDKTKMETTIKRLEHGASILSTATDDQTYAIALQTLESVFPGATKEMPPQFDPQVVASKLASGQTIKDKLAAQLAQATQAQTVVRDTQTNDRGVASNLTTQRGQDMTAGTAKAGQAITVRGQNMADSRAREGLGIQREKLNQDKTGEAAKTTEGERTAGALLQRMRSSQLQLQEALKTNAGAATPNILANGLRMAGADAIANGVTSESRQQVEAAQLDILDAALTLGTGAAYTREQLEGYRNSYFPQINDDKKTVADKKVRLKNILQAAEIKAGGAAAKVPTVEQMSKDRGITTDSGLPPDVAAALKKHGG